MSVKSQIKMHIENLNSFCAETPKSLCEWGLKDFKLTWTTQMSLKLKINIGMICFFFGT